MTVAPPSRGRLRPAKPHPRVYAFDDSPFTFSDRSTPVVGVIVTLPGYVEGVVRGAVTVDGTDATDVLIALVRASPHREATQAILLDGITFGGFNVVDMDRLHDATRLPVITVTRRRPDLAAMETAMGRHLPAGKETALLLRAHPLFSYPCKPQPLWVSCVGAPEADARALLKKSFVRGSFPEPLRLAHLFASAIPGGPVSRSRA